MAGTDFSQQIRQGVDALRADDGLDQRPDCAAADLKGLLNAIVDQISEADRRHSDTLQQLQERMVGIGREAKAIKPRVPDLFASAFERIEAGMSELAFRITEVSGGRGDDAAVVPRASAPTGYAPQANFAEPPAALRSAFDPAAAATRRREEEATRAQSGIDTFDVIESSLPGNVSDPWDRDAAEALTGLYESGAVGFSNKSLVGDVPLNEPRNAPLAFSGTSAQAAVPGVDHIWLEARFAEISKRLDESLSEMRPDQGFFAVGQRVDQLEQHFSNLIEGVATRGDVEGVRLIEAHVSELAGHLESAHNQLMRLDMIEDHLAGIAGKLDDVHRAAMHPSGDGASLALNRSEVDLHAVARTAAEAAAEHFAKLQPQSQAEHETWEIRDMLRGLISETRQGEENTSALLDTLQQAMIRLLDRVDAIELNTIHSAQAHHAMAPAPDYMRDESRFGIDLQGVHGQPQPTAALDAAVAAVATAKSMASPFSQAPGDADGSRLNVNTEAPAPRSPDKIRQDFIAEARRAKMRLAAEAESEVGGNARSYPEMQVTSEPAMAPIAPPVRGASKASASAKASAAKGSSPRLKVMALGAILAMGAGWYVMQSGHLARLLFAGAAEGSNGSDVAKSAINDAKSDAHSAPGDAATTTDATAPAGGATAPTEMQNGTRGEIVTDPLTVGSTSVPLFGVAVDSEKPMTVAELARAKRQQAMAAVSGQLGQAATQNSAALAMPASLQPEGNAVTPLPHAGNPSIAASNMSQSTALDLPPATVGPLSLRLAAANGDPSAEFEVGARMAEGKGTGQSFKDAAKWYQRSASKGFAQAQYRLGTLYERGLGLKADQARAEDWYRRAAEQGNIKAMHNLAVLSANQLNGSPDYATAATWFEKAADLGLSDSQFNLAVLRENGLGVEQDLIAAYKWLALAARSGDREAVRRRDILKGKLTAEQLAKAESLVTAWKSKMADPQVNDARKAGEAWKNNPANGVNG